ncbi:hypothetical protein [Neolewinella persica]|uniref:hypothetical protein n=1 Tax=Neolewinella persica TaxID=70998 RepID=UPI000367009C|nr:hypothetical protein [Neolewinella persica]
MKFFFKSILVISAFLLASQFLSAQETATPQNYHVHDYFAVPAGGAADYLAMEKVWKKIHQANIKSGKYTNWELSEILMPGTGVDAYNYVTRTSVRGEENLAALLTGEHFDIEPANILTKGEMEVFNNTGNLRTFVKREVYTVSHLLPAADWDKVKVAVHNHFDFPESGGRSAHVKAEKDIWDPVHAARIKAGKMLGWVVAAKMMPWGADEIFHDVTVDLYESLPGYLANRSPMPYFAKVHPDKDIDQLMAQTEAAATLVSSEVRLILENVHE